MSRNEAYGDGWEVSIGDGDELVGCEVIYSCLLVFLLGDSCLARLAVHVSLVMTRILCMLAWIICSCAGWHMPTTYRHSIYRDNAQHST